MAEEKVEKTVGQELVEQFDEFADVIRKDLIKFFDKEQMAPARRCRVTLSGLSKWNKSTRALISEEKAKRKNGK
jgi:hypothetical protein